MSTRTHRQSRKTAQKREFQQQHAQVCKRPTDFILRAQIDMALDELTWRQAYTNHTWLDMQFNEVDHG